MSDFNRNDNPMYRPSDPDFNPNDPRRRGMADDRGLGMGTALGAFLVLALLIGGFLYYRSSNDTRTASNDSVTTLNKSAPTPRPAAANNNSAPTTNPPASR